MARHKCTKDTPWCSGMGPAEHPDARWLRDEDEWEGEVFGVYKCPHCGLIFKVEIPQ